MAAEIGKTEPIGTTWPTRPARPVGASVERKQPKKQDQQQEKHSDSEDDNDDNPHIDEYV